MNIKQLLHATHEAGDSESVAIIITTRNRAEDLTLTLNRLAKLRLTDLPLYIIDDASDGPIADQQALGRFSQLTILTNKNCKGLVHNRNQLARIAKESILISLDDDACFTSAPDFRMLARWFETEQELCAVEFDNIEPPHHRGTPVPDRSLVQMFTGYGHAIQRERFLAIGGYREEFFHMCEERDFAQRAWRKGYVIRKYRSISVLHRKSPVARLHDRNVYYLARNTIIFNAANFGLYRIPWLPFAVLAMVTFWYPGRGRRILVIKAIASAFRFLIHNARSFEPMNISQARTFRRLPQR